ncbi:hypothetical protein [Intestinimonas butyriciproducens]|uniref:hypothetical protein n=1 Tax=Intestinimonas butyriciproducens TaxID=1297617 RepID=UPI00195EA656|nr:hypothetical protein [Intestinimonas butyriciproducens]MBM6974709.1 hypothetical protein [Intestinimonas butyriciproducens]
MKKLILLSLSMILAIALCSCGEVQEPPASGSPDVPSALFDLSAYQVDAEEFRGLTYEASVILANVGTYENNYWKTLGRLSEDMPEKAFAWLSENSEETQETVSAVNEAIGAAYDKLTSIDFGENADAAQIDTEVRALYDGYSALYALVTEPSGARENFVLSLSDLIEDIESANDALLGLLSAGE